jgi:hypothetical protein
MSLTATANLRVSEQVGGSSAPPLDAKTAAPPQNRTHRATERAIHL